MSRRTHRKVFRDARVSTHHENGRAVGSRIESPLGTFTVGWWPQKIVTVELAPSLDMLVVENRRGEKQYLSRNDALAESSAGGSMGGHDPRAHGQMRYIIRAFGKWADGKHSVCVSRIKTEHPELAKGRNVDALCAWIKDQWAGTTKWRGKGSDPAQKAEDKAIQTKARSTAYARFTHSMPVAIDAPGLDALVEDVQSLTGISPEQVLTELGAGADDRDVFEALWEAEVQRSSSAIASIESDLRRYLAAPQLAIGSLEPLLEAWLALHGAPADADEDPASLQECARFVLGGGRPASRLEQRVAAARESIAREVDQPRGTLPALPEERVEEAPPVPASGGVLLETAHAAGDDTDIDEASLTTLPSEVLIDRADQLLEAHGLWTRRRHDALERSSRAELARSIKMLEASVSVREDAPAPFRLGDLVAEAADDLSLGRRGKVIGESVDDDGAWIYDVLWEDGTGSKDVRQFDLRNLSWGVTEASREPVAEHVERLRGADTGEWQAPLAALQREHGYSLAGAPDRDGDVLNLKGGETVRLEKDGEPAIVIRFGEGAVEPLDVAVEHPGAAVREAAKNEREKPEHGTGTDSSSDFESKHPRAHDGNATGGQFIKAGSSGGDVKTVQDRVGAKRDGKFGDDTTAKVKAFQKRHGLQVDGVVGHQTAVQLAGGEGKTAQVGALKGSDREKFARLKKRPARESDQPPLLVEVTPGPGGRRRVHVTEAGFDPRQPRDGQGRWRDVVGKAMSLKVGDKPVRVKRGLSYDIEKVADTGSRKYRVTRQSPNKMVPAQRVYADTAVDAADAAFGISPAHADSLARNIRAGRSQSERRQHRVLEGSADAILGEALAIVDEALSAQRVGWHGRAIQRPHAPRPYNAGTPGYVRHVKGFSAGGVQRGTGYARRGGSQRVRRVQTYLSKLGYSVGARDGKFGNRTEGAVRAFQQKHGLRVDGVVGAQTLRHMRYRRKSAGTR